MFGLLKAKNPYEQDAARVYAALLSHARIPAFYSDMGVPDTFEGRFDLLSLHVFMVMHVVLPGADGKRFNQALFDVTFSDMDQALREAGRGDMGVPKHMRRMMKAFNGRMHAYETAIADEVSLQQALARNIYGASLEDCAENAQRLAAYILENVEFLQKQPISQVMSGVFDLKEPKGG
jgi:cytochrome b pre-mRNA-processing protein 3